MNDDRPPAEWSMPGFWLYFKGPPVEDGEEIGVIADPDPETFAYATREAARKNIADHVEFFRAAVSQGALPPGDYSIGVMRCHEPNPTKIFEDGGPDVVTFRAESRPRLIISRAPPGPPVK